MRFSIILLLIFSSVAVNGQKKHESVADSITVSADQLKKTLDLLKDLNTKGIDFMNDSLVISEEFSRLLSDEAYFKTVYPDAYSWEQTIAFIEAGDLKKAFWFLINLYPLSDKNKELVIRSVLAYDAMVKMDQVLINTFYTYAFADPEASIIADKTPEITKPDIFENKLRTVKELILYIYTHREQNTDI